MTKCYNILLPIHDLHKINKHQDKVKHSKSKSHATESPPCQVSSCKPDMFPRLLHPQAKTMNIKISNMKNRVTFYEYLPLILFPEQSRYWEVGTAQKII